MPVAASNSQTTRTAEVTDRAPPAIVVSMLAGFAAAWIAAGDAGLLGRPLQLVLMWLALAVAILAAWPRGASFAPRVLMAGAILFSLLLTSSAIPSIQVLLVAVILAALSQTHRLLPARLLLIAATSITALGCFRFACDSAPVAWQTADLFARVLGSVTGWIIGQPLSVGSTFAGLDFLVLAGAFYAGWLLCTPAPRRPRAVRALIAIAAAHFLYLAILAYSKKFFAALPEPVLPPISETSHLGLSTWSSGLRSLIPWNIPLLGMILHTAVIACMMRLVPWLPVVEPDPRELELQEREERKKNVPGSVIIADILFRFGPVLLALAATLSGSLALNRPDLQGKKIVAYERGYLDWLKPEYDSPNQGFYGLLPTLVESLGGQFSSSRDLTAEDLAKADVLVAIHPDQPWPQDVLQRVWDFVRRGGTLLVVAEPAMNEAGSKSSFNELLAPSSISVRSDAAVSQTGGWEQSCAPLTHACTLGMENLRSPFGIQVGPSLNAPWPARPAMVGRWGWSDPGDAAVTGRSPYSTSKRLGDLILAAEQPFGNGRVFVLSDTLPLRNEMLAATYPFVGRLLISLASKNSSPQVPWRQMLTLLTLLAMLVLLTLRPVAWQLIVTPAVMAISLLSCSAASYWSGHVLPDGRPKQSDRLNTLAYIDASHLEAYSNDPTAEHGIKYLQQTLMRHGFLPLLAPDLSKERLDRAALLVSIGPAREFTSAEHQTIKNFVGGGGTFIMMVGANESRPSADLLADFGLRVPPSPVPSGDANREPEPRGSLAAPLDSPNRPYHFYAAWPVESLDGSGGKMVSPGDNSSWAYVYRRSEGSGTVVVIGDTHFASNENFAPEGRLANNQVLFWRWLLSNIMRGEEPWTPAPQAEADRIADPAEKSQPNSKQGGPGK